MPSNASIMWCTLGATDMSVALGAAPPMYGPPDTLRASARLCSSASSAASFSDSSAPLALKNATNAGNSLLALEGYW